MVLLLLGASLSGAVGLCAERNPSPAEAPASLADATAIINADFDGDNKPDLAIGSSHGLGYLIEIQFSSPLEKTYLTPAGFGVGIRIFAYDIDRDSCQDLIVTSAASLLPIAVYLGDGKGHFQEAKPWSFLPIALFGTPYCFQPGGGPTGIVSLMPQTRFASGEMRDCNAAIVPQAGDFLPGEFEEALSWYSANGCQPRSPPLSSRL